jgi:S1-C subfamily serine protease
MRTIAPLLLVSLGFCQTLEETFQKTSPATVLIRTNKGSGSGFIVGDSGLVVTAHHVIRDATTVSIKTLAGEVYQDISLLAEDEQRDFAILKFPGFGLPVIALGDSRNLKPGANVIVLGTPLGSEKLQASISSGIVSGIREIDGYTIIQITAPISPGNSGGPVLTPRGEVVGVAVFKLTGGESLNFALPINYVRGLLDDLSARVPIKRYSSFSGPDPGPAASSSASTPTQAPGFPGRWKSSSGSRFVIEERGDRVLLSNLTRPEITFDVRRIGNLLLGTAYRSGESRRTVYRLKDADRLEAANVNYKDSDSDTVILQKAAKALQRPDALWIRE